MRIFAACFLAALFALGGLSAVSQQDDGPVLRPKQPRVKQAEATLLVMCDISCNWKLDGVAQGLIEAGASAKTKVGPGLHLVAATTVDGLDQDQRSAKLETKEPTLVSIALRPVREARIKIKEDARKEMELQQREALRREQEQAARELELREQRDKEQAAQEAVTQQAETLYKDRHYIDAIPLLEKSCTAGNSDTCEKLGSVYEEGKGIPKNYSRALALYSRACDTGNADGCNSFGAMYDIGRGVAKDDTRAAELYSKACDGGSAEGCNDLGTMYLAGRGVGDHKGVADCESACIYSKDYPTALKLFSKACDAGSVDGCFYLGSMYSEAYGVTEDESMAITLFTRACDVGSARGCYVSGIYYRTGNYVQKDLPKAKQFLSKGCSLGSQLACDAAKKMR